jgi:hypothetical protein
MVLTHWRRSASFAILIALAAAFLVLRSDGDPNATAITGELVETYCWAKLEVGGPAHTACAIQCAKRGIPVAVIEEKSRVAYVLLPGKHESTLSMKLIEEGMGKKVTIRGQLAKKGQSQFLTADAWALD